MIINKNGTVKNKIDFLGDITSAKITLSKFLFLTSNKDYTLRIYNSNFRKIGEYKTFEQMFISDTNKNNILLISNNKLILLNLRGRLLNKFEFDYEIKNAALIDRYAYINFGSSSRIIKILGQ